MAIALSGESISGPPELLSTNSNSRLAQLSLKLPVVAVLSSTCAPLVALSILLNAFISNIGSVAND